MVGVLSDHSPHKCNDDLMIVLVSEVYFTMLICIFVPYSVFCFVLPCKGHLDLIEISD